MRCGRQCARLEEVLLELELGLHSGVIDRCGSAVDTIGRQHKCWCVEEVNRSPYANTNAFGYPISENIDLARLGNKTLPENVMLADAPGVFVNVEVASKSETLPPLCQLAFGE